jgi:hypothetical protein
MLAGKPNPNDAPKRSDIAQTSKVLLELTRIRINEEIIPSNIQHTRKAVLLCVLSAIAAPARAERIAAPKWVIHIIIAVSFKMLVKMLKAKEYHIKALDINTILARADFDVIPNSPCIQYLTI